MLRKIIFIFILFFSFLNSSHSFAKKIPRFASLKADEANVRTGPGTSFPVKWVFIKKDLPLEIIQEYDNWYKIKDEQGAVGWMHKTLVSNNRYVVVTQDGAVFYKNPSKYQIPLFKMDEGVRAKLDYCRADWCYVMINDKVGWVRKSSIWGVYQDNEDY